MFFLADVPCGLLVFDWLRSSFDRLRVKEGLACCGVSDMDFQGASNGMGFDF